MFKWNSRKKSEIEKIIKKFIEKNNLPNFALNRIHVMTKERKMSEMPQLFKV